MTLDGKILRGIFEHERLKPAVIRTNQANVQNLANLRQVMNTDLKFNQYSSSIREVLFETELKFCSKVTSFCSQTWLLLLVCLGKCFPFEKPKDCCSIQF